MRSESGPPVIPGVPPRAGEATDRGRDGCAPTLVPGWAAGGRRNTGSLQDLRGQIMAARLGIDANLRQTANRWARDEWKNEQCTRSDNLLDLTLECVGDDVISPFNRQRGPTPTIW
jgi:hypothetical protein